MFFRFHAVWYNMAVMITAITEKFAPLMEKLAELFQSHPALALYYTTVARYVFVLLALLIVARAIRSLLRAKTPPEIWAYLRLPNGTIKPLLHWENVLGRDKSADVQIDVMTVSRTHGALVRNSKGQWFYSDLDSKGGSKVNGEAIDASVEVEMGDTLTLGGVQCTLMPPSLEEKQHNLMMRKKYTRPFSPWASLIALTIFQIMTCLQLIASRGGALPFIVILTFAFFTITMWVYCLFMRSFRLIAFEMETIAFFLCTINLAIVATSDPEGILKAFFAILLGLFLFFAMCWYLRDLRRALAVRRLLLVISLGLLLFNIVFGHAEFGSVNWVRIAGMTLQPSELVKLAYIFIGAATLDELYEKKNITLFVGFSIFCLGCLAIMNDFGTAAIFFVTFLIISYLRSGDLSQLILVVGVCGAGALLAIRWVPHITQRFATWMHAWDYPNEGGWQQASAMAAGSSGGCFGLGAGNGWFHQIPAADTDLVFSYISEEWGLIIAVLCVLCLITLGLFAVRSINYGRSTFYTIAACAATSLIIFQSCMNVLGSLDILPFTGVTLPFISNGGTSMLTSWGLLAFLKAADTRQNASLAVRSIGAGVGEEFDVDEDGNPIEVDRDYDMPKRQAKGSIHNYDDIYADEEPTRGRRAKAQNYDEIYGAADGKKQNAGSRSLGKRSARTGKAKGKEVASDIEKWLDFDAGTGKDMAGRRSAKGRRSAAKKSGQTPDSTKKRTPGKPGSKSR